MDPATVEQPQPLRFGRYEALMRIGRGGMAEVFAGRVRGEAGFQKLVAVKRMLPHLADDDKFAQMFLDEARLAANISSPHVVSTLDLGRTEEGSLYLVMELIVGVTLSTMLRKAAREGGHIPVNMACEILAQAAQGLHDAHEARTPAGKELHIVHRDVSPQNVLIGGDGRTRITDFGVARAMLRRTDTTTGELKGKLSYFSPEQVSDESIDRRSDVFALGIVAWETLTGRRLFKAENPLALLDRICNMPIPPTNKFHPAVPPAIDAIVQRALQRDRTRRYATTLEFARDLRAAARQHLNVPDRSEITEFVLDQAGERIRKLESSIRRALEETGSSRFPVGSSPIDLPTGLTARTGVTTTSSLNRSSAPAQAEEQTRGSEPPIPTRALSPAGSSTPKSFVPPDRETQQLDSPISEDTANTEDDYDDGPTIATDWHESEEPGPGDSSHEIDIGTGELIIAGEQHEAETMIGKDLERLPPPPRVPAGVKPVEISDRGIEQFRAEVKPRRMGALVLLSIGTLAIGGFLALLVRHLTASDAPEQARTSTEKTQEVAAEDRSKQKLPNTPPPPAWKPERKRTEPAKTELTAGSQSATPSSEDRARQLESIVDDKREAARPPKRRVRRDRASRRREERRREPRRPSQAETTTSTVKRTESRKSGPKSSEDGIWHSFE